jgi:hypothetical protein
VRGRPQAERLDQLPQHRLATRPIPLPHVPLVRLLQEGQVHEPGQRRAPQSPQELLPFWGVPAAAQGFE